MLRPSSLLLQNLITFGLIDFLVFYTLTDLQTFRYFRILSISDSCAIKTFRSSRVWLFRHFGLLELVIQTFISFRVLVIQTFRSFRVLVIQIFRSFRVLVIYTFRSLEFWLFRHLGLLEFFETFRSLDFQLFRHLGLQSFGYLDIESFGYLDIESFGYLDIQVYYSFGYLDIQVFQSFGYLDIQVFTDFWLFRHIGTIFEARSSMNLIKDAKRKNISCKYFNYLLIICCK